MTTAQALKLVAAIVAIRAVVSLAIVAASGHAVSGPVLASIAGDTIGFGLSIGVYALIALTAFKVVAYARG